MKLFKGWSKEEIEKWCIQAAKDEEGYDIQIGPSIDTPKAAESFKKFVEEMNRRNNEL